MEWVAAVCGALVEVTIVLIEIISFSCLVHLKDNIILIHRHGLRHDPWWSRILTFGCQRRKWHEPCRILSCLEPSAWQPRQPCYEPLYTKV